MPRALSQAPKITSSIASNATATTLTQPFTTSAPDERGRRVDSHTSKKSSAGRALILPTYSNSSKIKYEAFMRDLRNLNGTIQEITQTEAQRALRQCSVNLLRREGFENIRTAGTGASELQKDQAVWARLREEGQQYWQGRQ